MADIIRIQMMNEFTVYINEQKADHLVNKSRKGVALMQYLILHQGQPVPNYRLLATLWDEEKSSNPERKTAYDLIAVQKGHRLINMDSAAPNAAFGEFARAGKFLPDAQAVRGEVKYGDSRFDFMLESGGKTHYIEVKGVTLEENGAVRFPDAPTERGVKHLRELQKAAAAGFGAHAVFVIQMADVAFFSPNDQTHPAFGDALRACAGSGVQVHAFCCRVTPDSMELDAPVEVRL